MNEQLHPTPRRSRSARRGLVITAVAAAALFGGAAAAAAADIGGDGGSGGTPTPSAPATPGQSGTTDGSTAGVVTPPAHTPHLDGEVSSVAAGTILITDHEGFTRTINVTDSTTYNDGVSLPIEVGESIHAEGSVAADGTSLDATVIATAPQPPTPGTGGPAGGPGLGGPPAPPADGSAPTPPADGSMPAPTS